METTLIISLVLMIGITYAGFIFLKATRRDKVRQAHQSTVQAASPTDLIHDKYGNQFELCKKCRVPVILDGIEFKCMNGCVLGSAYVVSRDEWPSPDNNYNPTLFTNCSKCKGSGNSFFREAEDWCAKECDQCNGKGYFRNKKYSSEEEINLSQPIIVAVNNEGQTYCPKCELSFYVTDKNVFSLDRHLRCGQKLMIPNAWKSAINSKVDTTS